MCIDVKAQTSKKKPPEASLQESEAGAQQIKQSPDTGMRNLAISDFFKKATEKQILPQAPIDLITEYTGPN